jgi:hypothetical protein
MVEAVQRAFMMRAIGPPVFADLKRLGSFSTRRRMSSSFRRATAFVTPKLDEAKT